MSASKTDLPAQAPVQATSRRSVFWTIAIVGSVVTALYAFYSVSSNGWDPTVLLAEGKSAHVQLEYAERLLERDVATRPFYGHDGKFFFITANDPLLLAPQEHAAYLDRPVYRSQRVLYPALASLFGVLPPAATVWGLIVVNVVAAGIGTFGTSLVAHSMGGSKWLGLAFPLNFGVLAEIDIDGGGVVALAFVMLGIGLHVTGRALAPMAFTLGVLARETMLLAVGGLFLWLVLYRSLLAWRLLLVPLASAAIWRLYVMVRLNRLQAIEPLNEEFAQSFDPVPFRGLVRNASYWNSDSLRLLLGICLLLFMVLFARRAWRSRHAIAWAAAPFLMMSVFLSHLVWREPPDVARAVAILLIAYPLLLLTPHKERSKNQ